MKVAAQTIWDTGVQNVCAVVTARDGDDVEIWMTGNFGQVSMSPPKIIINPNSAFPIVEAVRAERRFALNVFTAEDAEMLRVLMFARARSPRKLDLVDVTPATDAETGIPYMPNAARVILCTVEDILDTGDHAVTIGDVVRIIERPDLAGTNPMPTLFPAVRIQYPNKHRIKDAVTAAMTRSGFKDAVRRQLHKVRPPPPADIQKTTLLNGYTEADIAKLAVYGLKDRGRVIRPAKPAAPPQRKVSVCVLGTGMWGAVHADLFSKAGANVALSIAGRNVARTARLAKNFKARAIEGIDAAIADPSIDAVAIVLPHTMHADIAVKAAAAGKHILIEKPLALTLPDADRIIEVCDGRVKLMVAENGHFRPQIAVAVDAIHRGMIGEPLYCLINAGNRLTINSGWKSSREEMGGGVLMDLGIHYIRSLRLLMGEPDRLVATRAIQPNTKMEGEDSIMLMAESRFGWRASMLFNWAGPRGNLPDIVIAGSEATMELWSGSRFVDIYPQNHGSTAVDLLSRMGAAKLVPAWLTDRTRDRRRLPVPGTDPGGYQSEVAEFLAAIAEDRAPASPGREGRRDLEIVLAGYRSLETGNWADVPPYRAP